MDSDSASASLTLEEEEGEQEDEDNKMKEFCKSIPKVELHSHLNGSLSTLTMQVLKRSKDEINQYQKMTSELQKGEQTLEECFKVFEYARKATDSLDAVYHATQQVIQEFAKDNTMYLELRTTPRSEKGMSEAEYIEAVARGIQESKEDIIVKLILSINRENEERYSDKIMDSIIKLKHRYPAIIRGVDFCGNPRLGAFDRTAFDKARSNHLFVTLHCAEVVNDDEVTEILNFRPDRIGHGTCLHPNYGGKQSNWNTLLHCRIPTEICMTSNVLSGTSKSYETHHVKEWIDTGLPFSLNTDDKGVFGTLPSKEYFYAYKYLQRDAVDLYNICCESIDQSFCSLNEKVLLTKKLDEWTKDYMD